MSGKADVEAGTQASTEIQTLIVRLLEQGIDAKAIAIATCGIGAAMVVHHFGEGGEEIGHGLIDSAKRGDLDVYSALTVANTNKKK